MSIAGLDPNIGDSTLVSCLMVTADRLDLARRSVNCFVNQHHVKRELIVVDDGTEDYGPMLRAAHAFAPVRHIKLSSRTRRSLGELRNIAVEAARGAWCMQWDDDEWYHPDRIGRQLGAALASGTGASALRWTLMQVPTADGFLRFRASTGIATPGTILFRRASQRYPALARNEDGIFLRDVRKHHGLAILGRESSHLFVRIFHGSNTWDRRHFERRLWRTPADAVRYASARFIHHDISRHSAFDLTSSEVETFGGLDRYLDTEFLSGPAAVAS